MAGLLAPAARVRRPRPVATTPAEPAPAVAPAVGRTAARPAAPRRREADGPARPASATSCTTPWWPRPTTSSSPGWAPSCGPCRTSSTAAEEQWLALAEADRPTQLSGRPEELRRRLRPRRRPARAAASVAGRVVVGPGAPPGDVLVGTHQHGTRRADARHRVPRAVRVEHVGADAARRRAGPDPRPAPRQPRPTPSEPVSSTKRSGGTRSRVDTRTPSRTTHAWGSRPPGRVRRRVLAHRVGHRDRWATRRRAPARQPGR